MYIRYFGRVESVDDTSFDREPKKAGDKAEHVEKFQVTISLPKCSEFMKFDVTPGVTDMPKVTDMEEWEDKTTWVVCEADMVRVMKGETDGRAWTMTTFPATRVAALSADESKQLSAARRAAKVAQKRAAAEKKAAKQAAKQAEAAKAA